MSRLVSVMVQTMVVTPLEINHWLVGGGVLAIFLVLLLGILVFGAGREHS